MSVWGGDFVEKWFREEVQERNLKKIEER